jgi:EARLY FLOWERING 3 protein
VKFQDVVNAFGQQEFWKTQMLMIRQQRIFSRQVFDLHRVIQVQQLLAKTLCTSTSIDEALEKENDKVHMAESPIAEVPEVPQVERPAAEVPEVPQVERPVAEVPEVPQAASPVAEVPQVSQAESSVAEVPEVPLIARAPQVPEISEKRLETKASNENSRPSLDSLGRPVYPFPVPTQQVFNSEAPWQAPPYATNPWAVRMASPFMYLPYPGPYPTGYGTYPMMMPMYAQPGALQQQPVQFPTWQQPGMPHLLSAQDSSAMAAWYGQHIAPPVAPAASASIAPHACHFERLESSGSGQSTSHMTDTRPAGQDGERSDGVVNPNKGSSGETRREGRWVLGDRSSIHKKASDGAGPRGNEAECQNGDNTALEGSDPDHGQVQQTNNVVEPEANLEGPQLLKRMRTETGFEAGACRWFPILSPARRPIHNSGVIKVVPRALSATPELAANILMSIQTDRRRWARHPGVLGWIGDHGLVLWSLESALLEVGVCFVRMIYPNLQILQWVGWQLPLFSVSSSQGLVAVLAKFFTSEHVPVHFDVTGKP